MRIKDSPKILRPREKLLSYSPDKLTNAELLAILLRSGTKKQNVLQLATTVLETFPHDQIVQPSIDSLCSIPGIGIAKACEIVACFELGKRFLQNKKSKLLLTPHDIFAEMRDIRSNKKEHLVAFFLDIRNQEIQRAIISVGTLDSSLVHPREVFEPAIRALAAQIIIAHNHPSQDPHPSEEDLVTTKRLVEAGSILGVEVIDHVIVTKDAFFSFHDEGLLS